MESPQRTNQLLEELVHLQRTYLDEYRNVAKQSLETQQRSVDRQEQFAKLYRVALIAGAVLVAGIVAVVLYLLGLLLPLM